MCLKLKKSILFVTAMYGGITLASSSFTELTVPPLKKTSGFKLTLTSKGKEERKNRAINQAIEDLKKNRPKK